MSTATAQFVEFLKSLAPEGETPLIVRQKPRLQGGEVQLHPDGAVVATWPAFLPDMKHVKAGQAWYGNTASYVIDRFEQGKPSASAANCDYCLVLVLDDVGTKSKQPPLPPTWIMETSPGSFQWGYAFDVDEQPTKDEFAAAIRAIADAGYTDPGALNPVRNFRLPGSVNLKPGRDEFASRLVEFHPSRMFTLPAICAALGVTPAEPDSLTLRPIRVQDTGGDDVFAWLSEQNMILRKPNAEGWAGIVCPNSAQHSDGNPEGRYKPVTRSYCCLHSHCVDFNSQTFLDWVAEQGGPKHETGLREELMQQLMADSLSKIASPQLEAQAQAVIHEVERREAGRLTQAAWFPRYAYVENDDAFFDLDDRRLLTRRTFDAIYRHVRCWSIHTTEAGKRKQVPASIFFDENRLAMGARAVAGVTYAPGESVLCSRQGAVYVNQWSNARPSVEGAGNPGRWLAHVEKMIPDPDERAHVLDVMAYKLQHPERKINHAILHGGTPGAGKDTMWAPFLWAIGGPSHVNVGKLENHQVHTQWGYHLECEVLAINELRQTEAVDRRALENRLKPIIAAPPEFLTVERKGQHPYTVLNRLLVVAQTNQRDAIALGSDDRRWFVTWTEAPRMTGEEGRSFWRWLEHGGGCAAVAAWLYSRDVSAFNPGAAPPMTDAKQLMIGASRSMAESWLVEQIEARAGEFARGVVAGPWQGLCDRLQGAAPASTRIVPPAVLHALGEAGWADLGLCHSKAHKTKRHVWTAPWWAGSKTEARAAVEAPVAGLRVVG